MNKIIGKSYSIYIDFVLLLLVVCVACIFITLQLTKVKQATIVKNNERISNMYMESSPFVWKGQLKYFIAERDDKKNFHDLAIYDFKTRKREVSFGNGLGLGSAAVINNELYITATKDWFDFGKSEVYLITSKDLKTFSKPMLIYKAAQDQKIFNTDITRNSTTGNFVITYESQDSTSVPFTIYFLESKDGITWHPVKNSIFGKEVYVACPTIKYLNNYYYLLFTMEEYNDPNCPTCVSYVTKIARSMDLKKWQTSPDQFMVADRKDEGVNNSDVDLTEYDGKTYLFYAIGDQSTWDAMKYAVYGGSMKDLFSNYFNN